jgi:vacuolar-type H+-ATPase subunit D/Vma8
MLISDNAEITKRIDEAKRKMGRVMQIAAFSLAEVTYAVGGDIGYQVQESAKSARFRVRTKQDNVSGVLLPAFESYLTEGNNDFGLTGLGQRRTAGAAMPRDVRQSCGSACRTCQLADCVRDPGRGHQSGEQAR